MQSYSKYSKQNEQKMSRLTGRELKIPNVILDYICSTLTLECGYPSKLWPLVRSNSDHFELVHLLSQSAHAINIASAMANLPGAISNLQETKDATVLIPHLITLARSISSGHNPLFVKDRSNVEMSLARLQLWRAAGRQLGRTHYFNWHGTR
ncbi:hypothetical protein BCR33DRAFT_190466 [Rhizoclosmatium globosum]|uniref:Uncharacterized protein n=1 Tax=Rhizoclosmatium globosum TaxID=329046 RepID=A0A1Y2D1P6_9FUNG|nr:hypothetical protein BCR33DRAFT_190466 [Rhizoclosmatium globosum]|eukprot:ORY53208.1 hypothetical protein BCR33DRAFT_190466 [Rhizoclosmatium globosum]